jgi:uncharacterized RDD family membrane protein YckC
MAENNLPASRMCSLPRRFAAIAYDCLLLCSLFFFATLLILPFNDGMAISGNNIPYDFYLLLISYFYFTWQWTHGGQTLGMRAWGIWLQYKDAPYVSWYRASLRFLLAIFSWLSLGLGFISSIFDQYRLAFHDRYSNTMLVLKQG